MAATGYCSCGYSQVLVRSSRWMLHICFPSSRCGAETNPNHDQIQRFSCQRLTSSYKTLKQSSLGLHISQRTEKNRPVTKNRTCPHMSAPSPACGKLPSSGGNVRAIARRLRRCGAVGQRGDAEATPPVDGTEENGFGWGEGFQLLGEW